MNSNFEYSFKIHVDRKEGESHLEAFRRAFIQTMRDMGKSASDIATFEKLAQDLDAGRLKLDEVDKESRELYETWKRLSSVAADKDLLGIHHYQEIREEIEATRAAYERLAESGQLAGEDLAQAAQNAEARIKELKEQLKGWGDVGTLEGDRGLLGIKPHKDIQKEIDATNAAYKRLKASGTLTKKELAQAALKTQERIRELTVQTNGWQESLANAKMALADIGAVGASLVKVAGTAVNFEAAMAGVAKVVDGTDEQIAGLAENIKKLSTEIPLAASELAQIAAAGGQLGIPIDRLEEFTRLASQMSVAFGVSAEEAGQAVAKLSNIFALPIDEVGKLGDAINTLGNTTAATEANIVEVLTRIGGTAKQFGLSAEQASALAATMLSMGVSSQVAGTGINALLSKLQTANIQGKGFQDALSQMGISAEKLAADIAANPQKALTEFLHTLEQLEGQDRAETHPRLGHRTGRRDLRQLARTGKW